MNIDTRSLMVTIRCLTYNQEKYIRQCLEGFVMQKTDFRFEAIVHDDASTDGTADIIREYEAKYPDIIKPIYEIENQYSKHDGSLGRILAEHTRGKYIAICEGDDYWIDPLKLQKQVDFLESHPDYGLIYTNHFNRIGDKVIEFREKGYTTFDELLISSGIGTLTACYRVNLYLKYIEEINPQEKKWLMGDAPLWKYLAYNSKIKFIPDYTAVYRILQNSASHSTNYEKKIRFIESGHQIQSFFINKYISDNREKASLQKRADSKMIKSIFNLYYVNRQEQKLSSFMKENMVKLDALERIKCYLKYVILKFKLRFA